MSMGHVLVIYGIEVKGFGLVCTGLWEFWVVLVLDGTGLDMEFDLLGHFGKGNVLGLDFISYNKLQARLNVHLRLYLF